jgi:hypothetical protein
MMQPSKYQSSPDPRETKIHISCSANVMNIRPPVPQELAVCRLSKQKRDFTLDIVNLLFNSY